MALSRENTTRIIDILRKNPRGLSITDMVKQIGINRNTAGRYLENLLVSGQVEMRHFGMAKIYTLSNRTPQSAMFSISSDLVMQLDSSLRIVFANEPFLNLLEVTPPDIFGKTFEYSAAGLVFEDTLEEFITILKSGIAGKEWHGTLLLNKGDRFFSGYVIPAVFNDGRKGVSVRLEDLTELRQREHALQESEARLRSIISAAPVGIGVVVGRAFIEVNNRLCQMTGYTENELIGKSSRMLYQNPEEFERVGREKYSRIGKTGTGTVQTRWKRKDGEIIDILISSAPLNPDDPTRGVTSTALDITQRTRAERNLRESEERYRQLAEVSNDLIFVINRDDRVEYVNRFAASVLNKSAEEIIGSLRSSHFPEDVNGHQTKRLRSVFETGVPVHGEEPLHINGRVYWFDNFLMPLKDPDGYVRSVLGVSRDLTDRVRAEKALRDSEQNYRGVIENLQDVFYRADNNGRILMASPSVTDVFGYDSVSEVLGKNVADLYLDPRQREEFLELIKKTGSVKNFEVVLKRKDGTPVIVSACSHYYCDADGTVLGIEGITKDITEWKKAEEELFNSRQMLQLVLDTIPVRVFWKDLNSAYLGCNRPFALDAGCPDTEILVGKNDYDTSFAKTADLYRADDREVMETGLPKLHYEEPQSKPDGSQSWLRTSKVPLRNIAGDVIGVLGTYEDITERKRMEIELNAGAERYQQLAECSLDAIVITDLSGNVIMTNQAALTLFEVDDPESFYGTSMFRFVAPESLEDARRDFVSMNPERKAIMQTYTGITARGNRVSIEVLGNQILYKGKRVNIISVRDITLRKNAEETAHRMDSVLHGFAAASGFLLTDRLKDPIPRVLATIGEAIGADIAYVYQDTCTSPSGFPQAVRKFHWVAKTGRTDSSPSTHHVCGEKFAREWAEQLASGAWITGTRSRFADPIRQMLDDMGILSVLIVPIHVRNNYWGFIGFSDTRNERLWSDTEIEILMTLASTIGLVLEREKGTL